MLQSKFEKGVTCLLEKGVGVEEVKLEMLIGDCCDCVCCVNGDNCVKWSVVNWGIVDWFK